MNLLRACAVSNRKNPMTTARWINSLALAASLALTVRVSTAQPIPPPGSDAGVGATAPTAVRGPGGRSVYVSGEVIEVHGVIQRPYAFSVSGRSSLGYTYFEQSISFVREILDALRRSPF